GGSKKDEARKKDTPDEALRRRIEEASRKIQEAIDSGAMTEEEGREKLEVLRKRAAGRQAEGESGDNPRKNEALVARYKELEKRLKTAVEAGRMSAEDAEKKLIEARTSMFGGSKKDEARKKDAPDEALRRRIEEAHRKIQEAVEAGEMTEEEGREKKEQLRKRVAGRQAQGESKEEEKEQAADEGVQRRMEEAGRKIRESVAAGEITEEQGRARYEALRKRLISSSGREAKGDTEDKGNAEDAVAKVERQLIEAGTELRKAIADGEMTREEARARFEELRQKLAAEKEKARATDKKKTDEKSKVSGEGQRRMKAAQGKIEEAIAAGEITEEQGRERMEGLKRRLRLPPEAKESKEEDGIRRRIGAARREIRDAIAAGEMTAEEGREKMETLRKRVADATPKAKQPQSKEEEGIRRRLEVAGQQIREAIAAGEMTAEEGRKKLEDLRKKAAARQSAGSKKPAEDEPARGQRTFTREQYVEAEANMKKMVEAGRITPEQMRTRLEQMRKLIKD
ncbi:MAG: hypothetical protein AAEJ04_01995, partial [Planctomycetota bacterium]